MGPDREITVLLIEDSPEWALIAEQRLVRELNGEASVVHHTSLEESKSTLLEGGFDCVLLDLMLPDSAGLETVRGVRTRAPQAPIVVLSGDDDESIALRAVHEGAQDYLVKGRADGHQLARAIRYAIERKRGEPPACSSTSRSPRAGAWRDSGSSIATTRRSR